MTIDLPRQKDPNYPYLDNTNSDIRLVGHPGVICPFVQHTSASRLEMYSSHIQQALIVKGAEFPKIFTGLEPETGKFSYNNSKRDQDAEVLAVVPKYDIYDIRDNPRTTVIFKREDGYIDCVDIERYTAGTDGFGYENKLNIPQPESYLSKDHVLQESYAHKGDQYMMGTNANTAYMTMMETIEDAMMISHRLANKLTSTEIHKTTIMVKSNMHPINHYGDMFDTKFIPDIGDSVGPDGILCAFRYLDVDLFQATADPQATREVQPQHDKVYYAPQGARIVDMDFYVARSNKNHPFPQTIYSQVEKYREGIKIYWRRILEVYRKYSNSHSAKFTSRFNNRVTSAIRCLRFEGGDVPEVPKNTRFAYMVKKDEPVRYLNIDVTYVVERKAGVGTKITDRYGAKGIVCRCIPDEHMPTDQHGFQADLIIDPASVIKRMNEGQLYEQAINRTSELVRRRLEQEYAQNPAQAAHTLVQYYQDINPQYANKILDIKNTPRKLEIHVAHVIKHGIYLNIPPMLETMTTSIFAKLEAWGYVESPVTCTSHDDNNMPLETYTTDNNVAIGSKYVFALCKEPDPTAAGVSRISQHGIAIKPPSHEKINHPIRQSPLKLGADEVRLIVMNVDANAYMRFSSLQGNSAVGVRHAVESLLFAEKPTQLERVPIDDGTLVKTNGPVSLYHTIMRTMGIDSMTTAVRSDHDPTPAYIENGVSVEDPTDD